MLLAHDKSSSVSIRIISLEGHIFGHYPSHSRHAALESGETGKSYMLVFPIEDNEDDKRVSYRGKRDLKMI